eukprot:1193431-Prorocentrum_minimum.AAC.3
MLSSPPVIGSHMYSAQRYGRGHARGAVGTLVRRESRWLRVRVRVWHALVHAEVGQACEQQAEGAVLEDECTQQHLPARNVRG